MVTLNTATKPTSGLSRVRSDKCQALVLLCAGFLLAGIPSVSATPDLFDEPSPAHAAQVAGTSAHAGSLKLAKKTPKKSARKKKKKKWPGWVPGTALTPKLTRERNAILARDPERITKVGRHLMIGFHGIADVIQLLEAKAIAGIFITDHNMENRSVADMRRDIDRFQAIRKAQGLPPLLVAADQEGGVVSRLSPPLTRQASLAEIIAEIDNPEERRLKARAYGEAQGRELVSIGVNLNFAPVVDLNLNPENTSDGETRLRLRAISDDPEIVAGVADAYCAGLAEHGVKCTLKHFPGLGRIHVDTHRRPAALDANIDDLEKSDWLPFRRLMDKPHTVTMVGHVSLDKIDDKKLSSFSEKVLTGLIRERWQHDGLLVTDDFSMGAITKSKDGIGGAAVAALRGGMDIVLVSYSEIHLNPVLRALLDAEKAGKLNTPAVTESAQRLAKHAGDFKPDVANGRGHDSSKKTEQD